MAKIVLSGYFGDAGEPGSPFFNLVDVISMVEKLSKDEPLTVEIESYGGFVDVGQNVATYLENLKRPLTTVSNYKLASIAVSVFLKGQQRLIGLNHEGIIIHNPFGGIEGDADQVRAYAEEIQAIEDSLSKEYAKVTGIDAKTINDLLKSETKLNPQRAIDLHFATGFAPSNIQACAKININNKNENEMNENEKSEIVKGMKNFFTDLFKSTSPKAMILKDVTGNEIEFEKAEGDPAVGDVILKPKEGKLLMENGTTIVVVEGKITEIIPKAEPAPEATVESLTKEVTDLKAKIAEYEKAKAEIETTKKENETLKAEAKTNIEIINKVRAMASDGKIEGLIFPKEIPAPEKSVEEIKNEIRNKIKGEAK